MGSVFCINRIRMEGFRVRWGWEFSVRGLLVIVFSELVRYGFVWLGDGGLNLE